MKTVFFQVMNEFDITECTGPFDTWAFDSFLIQEARTVRTSSASATRWAVRTGWKAASQLVSKKKGLSAGSAANFPHQKWNLLNKYPNSSWFSRAS